MLLTASVLTKRAPEELTFTVNQYHIRKLENAKGKKNIKCITIGISLHKPLKCFKNIKVEVSKKKTGTSLLSRMVVHTDDGRVMAISPNSLQPIWDIYWSKVS